MESIQSFARQLISVDSSAGLKEIYTLMLSEKISYVPIVDNGGKRCTGVYRRKDFFRWFIENPGSKLDETPKNLFKREPFPFINEQTSLQETMKLLHDNPAVLVKTDNTYTHLITPRVVANTLEDYSTRFMVFEKLEAAIRNRIVEKKIVLEELNDESLDKPIPSETESLDFGQYLTIISKKWTELGLDHLDKKTIMHLLNNAKNYRNALMHFRLSNKTEGLEDAKKLLDLLS